MKRTNQITALAAAIAMMGAAFLPSTAIADDNGKGKKKGHYKNGKALRGNDSRWRGGDDCDDRNRDARWREDDDDWRRGDDRYRDGDRYDDRYWSGNRNNDRYLGSSYSQHRQNMKNEWRNIAIASGALSVLGALKSDKTLTFAGAAGALYSLYRYDQERRSQNQVYRTRALYFSQPYFYREGVRYERRTVNRGGESYYQFVRCS